MKITTDMFNSLCQSFQVEPRFLGLIRGMGYKTRSDDEYFMSCYCSINTNSRTGTKTTQDGALRSSTLGHSCARILEGQDQLISAMTVVSYNLRYVEKHGRDTRDPWSWRQSVFRHDYDLDCATSSWIVIQPPERWNASLDDVDVGKQTHPLSLHLRSLSSASANTWEYLEYLSGETLLLVSFRPPSAAMSPVQPSPGYPSLISYLADAISLSRINASHSLSRPGSTNLIAR